MNMNDGNLVVSSISSTNSFPNMASRNIHVLLVEDDSRDHDHIVNLLNYFSYKVTSVNVVSTAISILSKGKAEFDVVMANINSQDSLGLIQLLHLATTKMKLLVMFMSNVDDDVTSVTALDEGAFLCVKKPLSMEIAASLWQLVMSDKARKPIPNDDDDHHHLHHSKAAVTNLNLIEYHNLKINYNNNANSSQEYQKKLDLIQTYDYNVLESNNKNLEIRKSKNSEGYRGCRYKRKVWTEWTLELHNKFMAAARFLGQGKCYPKDILEIMNEPGLTRMQVASHLQKCRNANWLPPNERKVKTSSAGKIGERETTAAKKARKVCPSSSRARTIRFGVMPFWDEQHSEFHQTTSSPAEYDQHPINLDQELFTTHVLQHDDHHGGGDDHGSSNSRYLVHGLHPFAPDHNTGLEQDHFIYGDDQTSVVPHTDFLPNIVTDIDHPFEPLPIVESNNMVDDLPDFQKELEIDFDKDWAAFIQSEVEEHQQVGGVAAADNEWFYDEAFDLFMENQETGQAQMKEGSSKF